MKYIAVVPRIPSSAEQASTGSNHSMASVVIEIAVLTLPVSQVINQCIDQSLTSVLESGNQGPE